MARSETTERIENPFGAKRNKRKGPEPSRLFDVELRAMTGYEEEIVERRRGDANTASLCNEIVARCMLAPGTNPKETYERVRSLLVAERDLALITIRRLSFGDRVELSVDCPQCGAKTDVDFQLDTLPLEITTTQHELAVALPDGTPVSMRLPTAGDQEDLLDAELETESERRTFLLSRTILQFGERRGAFEPEFARALPVGTRNLLEKELEKAIPDLDLSMGVNCLACGQAFSAPFDVASFFLPK